MLAYLLLPLIWSALDWALFSATQGATHGAYVRAVPWDLHREPAGQYLYGFYPADRYWRISLTFAGLAALLATHRPDPAQGRAGALHPGCSLSSPFFLIHGSWGWR